MIKINIYIDGNNLYRGAKGLGFETVILVVLWSFWRKIQLCLPCWRRTKISALFC